MFRRIIDRIKEAVEYLMSSRLIVLIIVFCLTSSILIGRLFYLQIVRGEDYLENYELQIRKTRTVPGTRGNIFDRNGEVIAYNELAYSVTIEDIIPTDTKTEDKNKILNDTLDSVLSIVEENGDSVIDNFGIILDSSGSYQFAETNETSRLRFVADVHGKSFIDDLTEKEKNKTAEQIVHYLCKRYGLDYSEHDAAYILKMVNMRYAMGLNSYQQWLTTVLASDVSDATAAAIMENQDSLQGVDISEDSLRRYPDGQYFASIIGYTGQISQEEYDDLSDDEKKRYSLSDIVGKSGIEHTFDSVLQGEKGKTTFYVDNLGKVTDTVSMTDPKAGNDVYLTIDKNLQISAYKLLEEKLAGIVLSKLSNVLDYDPSAEKDTKYIKIPVGDAYNSFIANEIIDMKKFGRTDAKPAEQAVYNTFTQKKAEILSELMAQLQNENAPAYKDLSKEMKAYMDYICDTLLKQTTGILMSDKIEAEDETQIAWATQETISLNRYLNYAISKNWIDTSKLGDSAYSSSEEIYSGVLAYLEEYLKEDSNFDKLLYKYLIKSGSVTGAQICAIVYEQGVLPMDENAYNGLLNGTTDAYGWLYDKIKTLQITPGQLALEPCSGGIVVTDPNSGDVLACVSYPGYDNNRLSNDMDTSYYTKLALDQSSPFFNKATQQTTAPGSTLKLLSTVTGMMEGLIDDGTYIECTGEFDLVTPSIWCWNKQGHGSLEIRGAIEQSCNYFFNMIGFQAGKNSNGDFSENLSLEKLQKYASEFHLDQKTGIEISEATPHVSDSKAVPSYIGQGNHLFTTSQLARYATALATSGTVYDLSLLNKVTDSQGKTLKEYDPAIENTMSDVPDNVWEDIHDGMRRVVETHEQFKGLGVTLSGKTGTAELDIYHPNHGLFIGYTTDEKSQPEYAIAVRIANGYSSGNACLTANDILKYIYNLADEDTILTGYASSDTSNTSND